MMLLPKNYFTKKKKIELISPNTQIKDILVTLLNHNVVDDVMKIVKISKHFLIFHGKTFEGGNSYEAVVKVFWNFPDFKDEPGKRNNSKGSNSAVNKRCRSVPNASNIYQNMTVKIIENLLVFKVFADQRNIPSLIKDIKGNKCNDYSELLKIYSDAKQNHSKVIKKNHCFSKDLIWHDNKWKILCSNYSFQRSFPNAVATLEHVRDLYKVNQHKRDEHRQTIVDLIHNSKPYVFHYHIMDDFIDNYLMRPDRPNACNC